MYNSCIIRRNLKSPEGFFLSISFKIHEFLIACIYCMCVYVCSLENNLGGRAMRFQLFACFEGLFIARKKQIMKLEKKIHFVMKIVNYLHTKVLVCVFFCNFFFSLLCWVLSGYFCTDVSVQRNADRWHNIVCLDVGCFFQWGNSSP